MMAEENTTHGFTIAESMTISDLETLKVISDPMRLSILEYLTRPGTVKRIAEKLNKPATKLYYHFNLLEKHGLIQLVDTQVVSGIIEKHYQATARAYYVDRNLLVPGSAEGQENLELTVNTLFTQAKSDLLQSINERAVQVGEGSEPEKKLILGKKHFYLTPEQIVSLQNKLNNIIEEFFEISKANENDAAAELYKMFLVLHTSGHTGTYTPSRESDDITDLITEG